MGGRRPQWVRDREIRLNQRRRLGVLALLLGCVAIASMWGGFGVGLVAALVVTALWTLLSR